jgi:hypothetical protein
MDADNGGIDHLHSRIVGSGKYLYDAAPNTSPASSGRTGCSKWCMGQKPQADHAKVLLIGGPRRCH